MPDAKLNSKLIEPPSYQERVLFVGSNGGGKTKLAGQMLAAGYPRTVSIDIKGDFDPPMDYRVATKPTELFPKFSLFRKDKEHVLYRPKFEYSSGRALDDVLKRLFERARKEGKKKPFIVYIDEGLYLATSSRTGTMRALAVTGRSLNIGLWVSSQRPKWIPVEVRSEAWRWYIFYLAFEEDEKEVLKYSKRRIRLSDLQSDEHDLYSFWEIKRGAQSAGRLSVDHYPRVLIPTSGG